MRVRSAISLAVVCLVALILLHPYIAEKHETVHGQQSCSAGSFVNGTPAAIPLTCAPVVAMYTGAGSPITGIKCVSDSVTSATTTGLWSLSISAMGFTTVKNVQVQAVSSAATAAGTVNASISSVSTSTLSGITTVPSASVLGLIPLTANPTSATVYVFACGV